jgi:hypothetical protein
LTLKMKRRLLLVWQNHELAEFHMVRDKPSSKCSEHLGLIKDKLRYSSSAQKKSFFLGGVNTIMPHAYNRPKLGATMWQPCLLLCIMNHTALCYHNSVNLYAFRRNKGFHLHCNNEGAGSILPFKMFTLQMGCLTIQPLHLSVFPFLLLLNFFPCDRAYPVAPTSISVPFPFAFKFKTFFGTLSVHSQNVSI